MIMLRSWIFEITFHVWTLLVAVIGLPSLVAKRSALGVVRFWVRGVIWLARVICGITFRVEGRENIPQGPCIIAAQHQSSFETYALFTECEDPVFVLKRELLWIPFIGWYITATGLVPIDRGAGAAAMRRMLRAATAAVERGAQMLIFPEGTRVPPGETRPYKPGFIALYNHCDVPLVPLALNSGYTWGKSRVLKKPGEIVFKYLPPLPTGLSKAEILATLRERLETASAALPKA
ncbi:MAG: 1-acyl-sn-glycerol-3-phosphate acyltransferase [Rhodospirillaceae bacterium]|nr:1-acyl-sn-glycerol-3-phosphate acyltransferase [Rhodospirillaceae bacterium]